MSNVTQLLGEMEGDDAKTSEKLLSEVYAELRCIAAHKMASERPGQTLQATALVHEAWLRLSQQSRSEWRNRDQFFAMAAEVMRRILVDRARRRKSRKHGGDLERVEVDAVEIPFPGDENLVLEVNDALERFAAVDPEKAQVVKLRFFVGLENGEVASLMGISEKTVQRHWSFAKAWLARAIKKES